MQVCRGSTLQTVVTLWPDVQNSKWRPVQDIGQTSVSQWVEMEWDCLDLVGLLEFQSGLSLQAASGRNLTFLETFEYYK